ncbi:efflux RND transporter periplasmic adaptor subunit [Thiohalophilus sp.]|uniref:efflux RND transporter periplasmic adaptor subunit n=1 Tax=Thiohalophilus sp. TaxID=3028392 RepID=UPI002ACE6465|nr:efflux RND transporter periplasmic adaptor subunit [Thiohalophilus sp.]MDZ7663511.1 efflux RND transporter periplasmic adaptor subunit [Thiohalophilus sp.]
MHKQSNSIAAPGWAILLLMISGQLMAADYEARLEWERRVELGTPVQGVITEVRAQTGQRVEAGDVLVQLDDRGFRANVSKAHTRLQSLEAVREEARRERDRAEELYDRTVLSDHELQVALNDARQTEADYAAARAALVQARLNLEYSAVRAPFDALVINVQAAQGQTVINDLQPVTLVTVADANSMIARAELSEGQVEPLELGQAATVRIGGREHIGRIKSIGLEPVEGSDRYAVAVSFPQEGQRYRVGQTATIELP